MPSAADSPQRFSLSDDCFIGIVERPARLVDKFLQNKDDEIVRKSGIPLCLFMLFLIVSSVGNAQQKRVSFRGSLGMASPTKNTIDPGLQTGFGASFLLSKSVCLGLDFGFWKSPVEQEPDALMDGEIVITPLLASLEFFPFQERKMRPFCFAGVGYIFCRMRVGEFYAIPEITISQKVKSGPGVHAGAGLLVSLTEDLSFVVDTLFLFRKSTGTTTLTDMNLGATYRDFSVSLNSLLFRLGIRYNL